MSWPLPANSNTRYAPNRNPVIQLNSSMNTRLHQLLVTFMALWMPFCCCQLRAVADIAITATHEQSSLPDGAQPKKHRAHCCESDDEPVNSSNSSSAHTPGAPTKTDKGCCVCCKERALSTSSIDIDHDLIGSIDFVGTAVRVVESTTQQAPRTLPNFGHDTGPPRAPSGREALALHSTLLI